MRAAFLRALNFAPASAPKAVEKTLPDDGAHGERWSALLATRDADSRRWGPRWLGSLGFDVTFASSEREFRELLRSMTPDVMLVDAAWHGPVADPAAASEQGETAPPVVLLCPTAREVRLAATTCATDIARAPYNWQLIAGRCRQQVRADRERRELARLRSQMDDLTRDMSATQRRFMRIRGLDRLTRLPTRDRFRELLHGAISPTGQDPDTIAVLAIGIDRFQTVNGALGYELSNEVLIDFADRLKDCLSRHASDRPGRASVVTGFACRLGGVRFAIALSGGSNEDLQEMRQSLGAAMARPFEVGGHSLYLSISIGGALFPKDSDDADRLLVCAENALTSAKRSGVGFRMHEQPLDSASERKLLVDRLLREAVQNGSLELAYQPIVDTDSGSVIATEALLRWTDPRLGVVSPAEFVPLAEESGLMVEIGRFVADRACSQLRQWEDAGLETPRMAINLSLCQLLRSDVVADIHVALARHGVEPGSLEIELSERGVLNRHPEVATQIRRLKELGVRISIDDFGAGEASIAALKAIPVDVIKIDRSYVSGRSSTSRDHAIASGIVCLAARLGASVVAEGVETERQRALVASWGCDQSQGFFFARPGTPDAVAAGLRLR